MIDTISDQKHRARVSGIGQFANALGQIVGLVIFLPLSKNALAPLLPAVGVFFLLALPMMIRYKDTRKERTPHETKNHLVSHTFYKKLTTFFALSVSAPLLTAFFFYQDALVTITNNFSIYLSNILTIENAQITQLFIILTLMNGAGALLSGRIGDKI
jgi:MFS-type transporter involved in bile tolerance (Atg22 family)